MQIEKEKVLELLFLYPIKQTLNQQQVRRMKKGYIMIKGTIPQENLTVLNRCASSIEASRFIKQVFLEMQKI